MDVGVVFPQVEIGRDPERIWAYARRTERLGSEHLLACDHVLGVDPDREGWEGSFDVDDPFHEPFVLFWRLAAVTERLSFVTGALCSPSDRRRWSRSRPARSPCCPTAASGSESAWAGTSRSATPSGWSSRRGVGGSSSAR